MHLKDMIARRDAAQAAVDAFREAPLVWGKADCVRLCAMPARLLGHKVGLLKGGRYTTEVAAKRALAKAGFANLEKAADALFPQIAPAMALVADIVAVEGDGDWDLALMVALGNGRVLGFHEGFCRVLQPLKPLKAWRVDPCRKP